MSDANAMSDAKLSMSLSLLYGASDGL